ncbi:MAG: AAA family ATPase [Deltaproteobacteria bacterium]|nr:AAA family ATPase [Deltaproteobacteria bacterium]
MYTKFYGFREKPFNIISDPSFLYMSAKHRMALTYLEYGFVDGIGFILLTGEIGTGKTTLIKQFLKQIGTDIEVAVIFNTNVTADQLLEMIVEEFELEAPAHGKGRRLDVLNQFLINKHGLGRRVVLIVDESQNLSQDALEEIRMLSNLQTDKALLLQILLVGQPALRTRLQHPSLAQLSQRIAVSYHLEPLNLEETNSYIAHRLKVAGAKNQELFKPEAVELIFQYSGGTPRTINILCDAALVYGYADEAAAIEGEVIEHVVRDRQEIGFLTTAKSGEKVQARSEESGGMEDGTGLVGRVESIEQQVFHLSSKVDWHIKEQEQRAESFKDTLVQRLETMLAEERKRTDRLLIQYNLLRDRLNLNKLKSEGKKVPSLERKSQAFDFADEQTEAKSKEGSRRRGRLRKWFSK